MVDIQYDTTIMGGREVSRPSRVGFSPKANGFYPFGDATALAGEGGVSAVVWLIQASASNHKPKQTKGTVLLVCGLCGLLEIRYATALTTGAKH